MTDTVKQALEHIERDLKTIVTADELARAAGYSVFHFQRMFSRGVGTSVAAYITRRRLDRALAEISGGRAAVDAVLEYGFDTYAGFYKAFVKVYGCSPKKYLAIYGKHNAEAIMYTEQQLREILVNWNIPRGAEIGEVYIMDGTRVSGRVWTVGGGFVLKTGDRAQLLKNLKIAKALAAQGLPSALPVATAAGAEYLDGKEIFTLTRAISGSELAKPERWGRDRADYGYKYGRSIAKLHNALAEIEAEIEPDEVDLLKTVVDRALPETKRHNELWNMSLPDSFFGEYISGFGELFGDLPKQLIHRDPNPSNILFDGGEVSGFIDFDLSERNIRLWDVCYCATGILSEWRGVEDIHGKWLDLLGGILRG
ncbi:MAG: helix-turn-helix domain-containing protein, partial [Oscillospiraceae bacterium]|nr:helix-turn-helix domain-containing protein [Oscillospiraceae bacterium]